MESTSQQKTNDSEAHDDESSKPSIPRVPHHHHHHHQHQQQHQQQLQHQLVSFKRLVGACKQKDLGTIRTILNEQPELINQRDRYNRNLLHYTVILFRRHQGGQLEAALANSIEYEGDDDQQRQRVSQNLACFSYLLDRCHQKLWWQQDLDGLSLLHLAVISSNNPLARYIVYEHPYSIKYPLVCTADNERHSPLHWAVITNNLECVKLLIQSSAGVKLIHEPDFNGATALHYATQTSDYPKYRRQLRQMLRNVASDSSTADQTTTTPPTDGMKKEPEVDTTLLALHSDRKSNHHSLEVLDTLLKSPQVNIECRDKDRRTPLLWAASSGNRDAVLLLIGAGANPHSYDVNKLGALHCAASHGFTECLESLLSVGKRGSSTTDAMASKQSVNQPDNLNCSPIFYAVLSGNIDCVELLADRGAELDWQDSKGRSASHFAALKGQLNSLKLLRRRGANLWLANRQGDLPLHYAIKGGRHQVARWLLDHSPYENSVNAINNFGRAPIHLAIQRDDSEMLDYLIKRGANLNQLVKVKDRQHPTRHHRLVPSSTCSSDSAKAESSGPDVGGGGGLMTRVNGSEYHYETALDMAKKLAFDASLRLLVESGARAAAQVMSGRISGNMGSTNGTVSGTNVRRSLFDLQSAEGPSPIGFDTSSSSAASPHQATKTGASNSSLPKLSRPRPDSLPQSDSSCGSSALSQNSLTSIRGFPVRPAVAARTCTEHQDPRADSEDVSPSGTTEPKPFKGGISYNNERFNASIKCKLYDGQRSFPPFSAAHNNNTEPEESLQQTTALKRAQSRHQSAPNSGQEIITNVNVYTSPCPLAHHQLEQNHHNKIRQQVCAKSKQVDHYSKFCSPTEDESATTETSCDEANGEQQRPWSGAHLPDLQVPARPMTQIHRSFNSQQQPQQLSSRLPPSQGHEQHLPVILSDREEATTSGETSIDRSPEVAAGLEPLHAVSGHRCSPACEEPRFDKSERARSRPMPPRQQVRSPVGEYISVPGAHELHHQARQSHCYESHHLPDFSQVKPKVDSHRPTPCDGGHRSRSLSRPMDKHQAAGEAASTTRSVSRQTFTREHRQGSQDSFEFELGVERSIRKYKQEKRLFEELQGLKRSQIRSGRANEAVLVKRLVEHLRREQLQGSNDLLGMDNYAGAYTYKSYERFLYDQLRKLSQSNCVKLSRSMRDFEHELRSNVEDLLLDPNPNPSLDDNENNNNNNNNFDADVEFDDVEQHRRFLEEEMKADLELRRVIEGDTGYKANVEQEEDQDQDKEQARTGIENQIEQEENQQVSAGPVGEEQKGALEEVEESGQEAEVRRSSAASVGSTSRRSSLDVEERGKEGEDLAPLKAPDEVADASDHQLSDEDARGNIQEEANSICSAIMVDALGNLTARSPAPRKDIVSNEENPSDGGQSDDIVCIEEKVETSGESKEPSSDMGGQAHARRRSVVNIGNKMEVIYHNVGIEIDPAGDLPATDESNVDEEQQASETQQTEVKEIQKKSADERPSEPQALNQVKEESEDGDEKESPGEYGRGDTLGALQKDQSMSDKLEEEEESDKRQDMAAGGDGSLQVREDTSRTRTAIRRASSPPGDIQRPKDASSRRRTSLVDSGGAGPSDGASHVSEIKKVFNGYDLDELHMRRSPRAQEVPSSKTGSRRSPLRDISQKSMSNNDERSLRPTVKRTKKGRSRLPEKLFRPRVDVDQIKQRWSRVKAVERKRRMHDENRGPLGQVSYFAKSQPNLQQLHGSGSHQTSRTGTIDGRCGVVDSETRQNYELLYEINAKSKHERDAREDTWCQMKVVRIVDVRSLKRTLSLPESVMYSNDILKRFNILKL